MEVSIECKLHFTNPQDRKELINSMYQYSRVVKYGVKCLRPQLSAKKQVYKTLNQTFPNVPARTITLAVKEDISPIINSNVGLKAKNFPPTLRFDKDNSEFFVEENMIKVKMAIERPEKRKLHWIIASLMPQRSLKYKYYKILFASQKGYKLPFQLIMRNGQIYAKITVEKQNLLATSTKQHSNVGIDLNAFWIGKRQGNPMAVAFLDDNNKFVRQPLLLKEWSEIPKLIRKNQRKKRPTKKVVTNQLGIIIKKLLDLTKDYQSTFKLEDLTGLNKLRGCYSKFCYRKFIKMLETKVLDVQLINPEWTSQMCSKCGKIGRVKKRFFSCSCGYKQNRDINAAINIAKR